MLVATGAALAAFAAVAMVVSLVAARGGRVRRIALFLRRATAIPAVFVLSVGMLLLASQPLMVRIWPTQAGLLALVPMAFLLLALVAALVYAVQPIAHEGGLCVRCGHIMHASHPVCLECGTARNARVDRGAKLWRGVVAAFGCGAFFSAALPAWLACTPQTYRVEAIVDARAEDGTTVNASYDGAMTMRLVEPTKSLVPTGWMWLAMTPMNGTEQVPETLDIEVGLAADGASPAAGVGSGASCFASTASERDKAVAEARRAVVARAVEKGAAGTAETAGQTAEVLMRLMQARLEQARPVVPEELGDATMASLETLILRVHVSTGVLLAVPLIAVAMTFFGLSVSAVRYARG